MLWLNQLSENVSKTLNQQISVSWRAVTSNQAVKWLISRGKVYKLMLVITLWNAGPAVSLMLQESYYFNKNRWSKKTTTEKQMPSF